MSSTVSYQPKEKASLTSEDGQDYGAILMPIFASRPLTASSKLRKTSWSDSKDSKCRNYNSTGSFIHHHFANFEMLDAKIASALNKIIQNSQFRKKVNLEEQKAQKEDWFLRGRQIAFMIHDYFRVTGAHDTVLDYADLFSFTLHVHNS